MSDAREASPGSSGGLVHELRLFLTALQFLTRVPVPARVGFDPDWLNRCIRHFPLVGALVGAFGATVLAVAAGWWPPLVAAVLCVASTVWLTGAFHEDGLADTFDALGGSVSRGRALEIMKDSRIGSYGSVALGLILLLRVALIAALLEHGVVAAVVAVIVAHALGRTAGVAMMGCLDYAGDEAHAKAKALAVAVPRRDVAAGLAWGLLILASSCLWVDAPLSVTRCAAVLFAVALVVLGLRAWLRRRIGGFTGDTLGATEQLTECAVLMVLAATIAQ